MASVFTVVMLGLPAFGSHVDFRAIIGKTKRRRYGSNLTARRKR